MTCASADMYRHQSAGRAGPRRRRALRQSGRQPQARRPRPSRRHRARGAHRSAQPRASRDRGLRAAAPERRPPRNLRLPLHPTVLLVCTDFTLLQEVNSPAHWLVSAVAFDPPPGVYRLHLSSGKSFPQPMGYLGFLLVMASCWTSATDSGIYSDTTEVMTEV